MSSHSTGTHLGESYVKDHLKHQGTPAPSPQRTLIQSLDKESQALPHGAGLHAIHSPEQGSLTFTFKYILPL